MTRTNRLFLVQRLEAPRDQNSFRFRSSGLVQEAIEVVGKIFTPEYMGRSEFEGGIMQKCLANMWDRWSQMDTSIVEVAAPNGKMIPIYVVGIKGLLWMIESDVRLLAASHRHVENQFLKEPSRLQEALKRE